MDNQDDPVLIPGISILEGKPGVKGSYSFTGAKLRIVKLSGMLSMYFCEFFENGVVFSPSINS